MLLHLAGYGPCPLEQVNDIDLDLWRGFPDVLVAVFLVII